MLFLLSIGFFAGIPVMLLFIMRDVNILFFSGKWAELTTYGISGLAPLVAFQLFGSVLILIYSIIVALNYFKRRKRTPKMIMGLFIASAIYNLIIFTVANYIISLPDQLISDIAQNLFKAIILCSIYVPYLSKSKKIRDIFVC